jgi:hypothetical protein
LAQRAPARRGPVIVSPFRALAQEAPSGFEPLYGEKADGEPHSLEPQPVDASELPAELQRVVERITGAAKAGGREP